MIQVREKDGEYPCYLCEAVLDSRKDLRLHTIDSHRDSPSKVCPKCELAFKEISSVRRHIKTVHVKAKQYICSFCEKKYMHKYDLEKHFQNKHSSSDNNGGRNFCPHCHLTYPSIAQLKQHMQSVHNKSIGYTKCPFCVKVFSDPIYLKQHCKKVHGYDSSSLYICLYCPVVCVCENTLGVHMNTVHSWSDTYICGRHDCNEYFQAEEELTTHTDGHPKQIWTHKRSSFKCWECESVYDAHNLLMSHFIEHHQTTSRKFECQCRACTYSLTYFNKKSDDDQRPQTSSKKRKIVPICVHVADEFDPLCHDITVGKKKRFRKISSAPKPPCWVGDSPLSPRCTLGLHATEPGAAGSVDDATLIGMNPII